MRMCIYICHAWHVCGSVASTIYIPSCSEAKWPLCSCKGKGGQIGLVCVWYLHHCGTVSDVSAPVFANRLLGVNFYPQAI